MEFRARRETGTAAGIAPAALFCALLVLAIPVSGPAQPPSDAGDPVALHAAVGDTLDGAEAARWGIYQDVDGLRRVVFRPAPWGGFLAEIVAVRDGKPVVLQRNVRRESWDAWRADIDRGAAVPQRPLAVADPDSGFVWPEAPPPPVIARVDTLVPTLSSVALRRDDWAMMLGVGYKHSTTRFNDYFTDMLLVNFGIARPLTGHILPSLNIQLGQGDLNDDLEDLTGDGRSAFYAFEGALRLHTGLDRDRSVYLSLGGGYYMRSLRWGGRLYNSMTGYYQDGSLIREFSDWGGSVRAGMQLFLSARGGKAQYLDIGLRYEFYDADPEILENDSGQILYAEDRDRWLVFSIGVVFGL